MARFTSLTGTTFAPITSSPSTTGKRTPVESTAWRRPGCPFGSFDLAKLTSDQLVDLLDKPNDWYARTARRLLADRRDPAIVPRLKKMVASERPIGPAIALGLVRQRRIRRGLRVRRLVA